MVLIYTSYFANYRKIPNDTIKIAICLYPPKGWTGYKYLELSPSADMLSLAKSGNWSEFIKMYRSKLDCLEADEVVENLYDISGNSDIVLLCYEKNPSECHRSLVREWLINSGHSCMEI